MEDGLGRGDAPARSDELVWSDSSARAVLQLMVEAVAEMIGFEVAVLSVVLGDQMVTVAYTGPEEFREYVEEPDPVSVLDQVLDKAEVWERFRFLAAEDYDGELDGHWILVADEQGVDARAWHPHDVLLGLLKDGDRLIGVLSVDRPVSGLRPDDRQRRLLEKYAAQAERAVMTAFEREAMVAQIEHAESARRLIRSASMPAEASLKAVVLNTHVPLVEGFHAAGSWVQVFDPPIGHTRRRSGEVVEVNDLVLGLVRSLAPTMWQRQEVLVVARGVEPGPGVMTLDGELLETALAEMAPYDAASVLGVALGGGEDCLGFLAVMREPDDPPWTAVDMTSMLQIGSDLGAALVTARALERQRQLVSELQQLDDYRSQLISTLSHELRTPLAVISGNLELMESLELDEDGLRIQAAMQRGTNRMRKVVDDLLLLARVSDPQHPLEAVPVDVRAVAREVVSLVSSTAEVKGVALEVTLDDRALLVPGDADELDRMIANLLSNAVKYTPTGGHVRLDVVRRQEHVVVRVQDDGLGISEEDQLALFRVFFRSTNPAALREQGTGLGLAIVATIVERHGGWLEVDSRLGEGTTFTVTLPAGQEGDQPRP